MLARRSTVSASVLAAEGGFVAFGIEDLVLIGAVVAVSYLLGSIPTAVLVARRRSVDIRTVGDRNPGYWNTKDALGARAALPVLVVDAAKGALAVALGLAMQRHYRVAFDEPLWGIAYLCALAAMVGHAWPVFARFRGGRSVATFIGAAIVLRPLVALVALGVCLVLLGVTRRFALAARLGFFAFPVVQAFVDPRTHVAATGVLMSFVGLRFWQAHHRGDGSHPL
jgi:glycerol-3-phosphate acyltransferase PlsY